MLVPPMKQGVIKELLVECSGPDGVIDPTPYQHCFTLPHVAGSVGDNQCWESQDRHNQFHVSDPDIGAFA